MQPRPAREPLGGLGGRAGLGSRWCKRLRFDHARQQGPAVVRRQRNPHTHGAALGYVDRLAFDIAHLLQPYGDIPTRAGHPHPAPPPRPQHHPPAGPPPPPHPPTQDGVGGRKKKKFWGGKTYLGWTTRVGIS